jgi:hypothetical protein
MRLPLMGLALAGLGSLALAAGSDNAQVQASAGYNFYQSSDGVMVNSPQAGVATTLDQRTVLTLDYGLDAVSAASFNYAQSKTHNNGDHSPGNCQDCHSPVDALSGASLNYYEQRQFVTLGAEQRFGEGKAKVSWYHSGEHDYQGQAVHASWSQDLAGRDTNLTADLSHEDDWVSSTINPSFGAGRYGNAASLALTQLLSPRSEMRALLDYATNSGYQADPYAFVICGTCPNPNNPGNTDPEENPVPATAPSERDRWDLGLGFKLSLPGDSAFEMSYRYYQDTWDVQAHTLALSWATQINTRWGDWVLEPEYRYYTQTQAYFFQNSYPVAQAYMTRDLKLANYSSHWLGLDFRGPLGDLFAAEFRYGHYMRLDSLDYSNYFADGPVSADTLQFVLSLQ